MDEPTGRRELHITLRGLSTRQVLVGLGGLVVAVVAATGVIVAIRPQLTPKGSAFTNATLQQISGFTPYFMKPGFSTDFMLQQSSVHFQSGVLDFVLKDPAGKTLAFAEQARPVTLDPAFINHTKQFNTESGQALVLDSVKQTTGVLLSSDGTMVTINSPQAVGSDTMTQVLSALAPVKPQR